MQRLTRLLTLMLSSFLLFYAWPVAAQSANAKTPTIQDNSFLIEEAYNQEPGVVQHINTFTRSWDSHDWVYSFTQEWPFFGQKHQLSYTIPLQRLSTAQGIARGVGDMALNYRYQLIGNGETRVAIAPRLSVLLPTGDEKRGLGMGGTGVQFNLPVSVVLSEQLVAHANAGLTYVPAARNAAGAKAAVRGFNLGQSFIWLAHPCFNLMFETVWNRTESVVGPDQREHADAVLLNPGLRWAHNLARGLQIVPGISVPIGVGPSHGDVGLLLYLSFEHPFKTQKNKTP